MMRIFSICAAALLLFALPALGQSGIIKGKVTNALNNEPLDFATIRVQDQPFGAYSDSTGYFEITGMPPGLYNIQVAYTGYSPFVATEISVSNSKPATLEIKMEEEATEVDEVEITASPFTKTSESPVSIRTIGVNEIERNPGGNRDISKVIQSLPGVASTVGFRNDIIIRGGSPNENRFYLDGIEVPNINHFATQGASGGPVGLINVNFIREVDLYTGAFPANRGNSLSSVMDIKFKSGRDDRLGFNATIGSSDLGLTLEGPIGKKTTFLVSARRSYLQFLFKAIALPFLPTYNDFQFKTRTKFNDRSELIVLGLGAIDQFELNLEADSTEQQKYILGNLPINTQWNYTVGANYKYYLDNGFISLVASRNMLDNRAYKYQNNDETDPNGLILDYNSQEMENKFRAEHVFRKGKLKTSYGVAYEFDKYNTNTFNRISTPFGLDTIAFQSDINFHRYGAFGNTSIDLLENRMSLAFGLRIDGNSYSSNMANPFKQLSPRFSASYYLTPQWSLNFNTGIYYQLPPYTTLGYRDEAGVLVNKPNLEYVRNKHIVAGVEYNSTSNAKITVEGFYKDYDNYPLLLRDSVSLANLGGDFGVIGNEPASSSSEGRAYGFEVMAQQKLFKGFFGIVAYTFVRSEFTNGDGIYRPASWDNRHIVTTTAGKKFKRNWEIGLKWRFYGGSPYTPFDLNRSSLISVWDITGRGLPDYDQVNSLRLPSQHQLDFRVDKKWFFEKWSLNLYLDIQNAYNFQAALPPFLDVARDDQGNPIQASPTSYETRLIDNTAGTLLPSIGVVIDI